MGSTPGAPKSASTQAAAEIRPRMQLLLAESIKFSLARRLRVEHSKSPFVGQSVPHLGRECAGLGGDNASAASATCAHSGGTVPLQRSDIFEM